MLENRSAPCYVLCASFAVSAKTVSITLSEVQDMKKFVKPAIVHVLARILYDLLKHAYDLCF